MSYPSVSVEDGPPKALAGLVNISYIFIVIRWRCLSFCLSTDHKAVVCATTASLLSTFAGYPLDSIKSRLQASRTPITVPRLTVNIFREEGIAGFYRGIWIPLVTISAVRAVSFTIYNGTKERLHGKFGWSRDSLVSVASSGALGGALAGCLISFGSARTSVSFLFFL